MGESVHTRVAPLELYNTSLWTKQCAGYTKRWTELHTKYAKLTPKETGLLIVRYEDIKTKLRFVNLHKV